MGLKVQGTGFGLQGVGSRAQDLGSQGVGFRV